MDTGIVEIYENWPKRVAMRKRKGNMGSWDLPL